MRENCYDKPTWTLAALAGVLPGLPRELVRLLPTLYGRLLSNAERERIMLAVAAENRCRYCQVAHGRLGRAAGLSAEEISFVLDGREAADLSDADRLAVRYARDLAARGFASADPELRSALEAEVGRERLLAIEASARVMNFANRFGNTFDALLTRLRGGCDSTPTRSWEVALISVAFLAGAAVMAGPIALCVLLLEAKR